MKIIKPFYSKFNNFNIKLNPNLNPKSLLLIAMVVFCAGMFAVNVGTASAQTVYVATDGTGDYNCDGVDDHIEINQALSYINDIGGGTVHLKSGTYIIDDTIIIYSNTTFQGDDWSSEILLKEHAGWPKGKPLVTNAHHDVGNSNIVIRDLHINGNRGVRSNPPSAGEWTLQEPGWGAGYYDIVQFTRVNGATLTDLRAGNGFADAIALGHCKNITVQDCTLYESGHDNVSTYHCENISVINNKMEIQCNCGVRLYSVNHALVKGNFMHPVLEPLDGKGGNGIQIQWNGGEMDNVVIEDNVIFGVMGAGVQMGLAEHYASSWAPDGPGSIVVRNNIIYHCGGGGVSFSDFHALIENNTIFSNSHGGIMPAHGYFTSKLPDAKILTVKNNIIVDNKGPGISLEGANNTSISSNYDNVWNNEGGDYNGDVTIENNISVDPLFVKSDVPMAHGTPEQLNIDLHLKSQDGRWKRNIVDPWSIDSSMGTIWSDGTWITDGVESPCIDAGNPLSIYSLEPSSNGNRINMGAYGNTVYASKSGPSGPDTIPPYTSNHNPAKSATGIAKDTNIIVHIIDKEDGVDQSSITMRVEGAQVSPTITGTPADYFLTYNSPTDFNYNQVVNVTIDAQDLASTPNTMPQDSYSFTIESEPLPDTTPPIRSNHQPSGILSYGTTSTTLSLSTDENATCKYSTSADVDYASMPSTFSTTGTTSHSQTISGLTNGNSYTYYIRCQDTIGNPNTDDYSISFSINSEPLANLVAHWKFDENSGDIAYDSSVNNNNGTLTNMDPATDWVDGKIGNALSFDGTNDYVDCGNANSIKLAETDMTISVWINPESWMEDQVWIVVKTVNGDGYKLQRAWGSISFKLMKDWVVTAEAVFPISDISFNSWNHLVATFDGSNAKIYLNTILKDEQGGSYGEGATAQNLMIGADGGASRYNFNGAIDDVRIYNRALTAAEVLAHYQEGNQPPINHDPIGTLDSADQTQITGWAYDANANSNPIDVHIYIDGNPIENITANLNRSDIIGAGDGQVEDPNHGFTFSTPSLSIGEHTVSVYAINQPEGTNPELVGSPKTFTVSSSDTTPPTGSIQINSGNEKTNSQTVNLTISANDESGLSEMKISNSNDFNSVVSQAYSTIKSWVLSTGDGLKTVYVWFKDNIGNWNITPYSDTITLDSTGPTISNISVSNITTNTASITFQTNEPTTSHLEYGLTSSYGNSTSPNPSLLSTFNIQLSSLSSDTTYHFKIISKDELENESNSIDQIFKTIGLPDTTPPSRITDLSSSSITQTSVDLSWTSKGDDGNNGTAASYDLRYSTNLISDSSTLTEKNNWWNLATQLTGLPIPSSSGTEQYISVGLSSNTSYYFAIKSADEVPNWSDYSNILSLKTLEETTTPPGGGGTISDTTPPNQPSSFKAIPADSQITLNWKNPNDSDFVRIKLLRKENSSPTSHNDSLAKIIYEGVAEQYTDINLNNNTTYYYSIFAYDKKPNYSKILTISSKPIEGLESIEIPNGSSYPEQTLLKTPDSFKIYIIINQKKKWISTPEVFETLGYQWTNITIIEKNQLTLIPDYEDNLIRAINDFKVYLIVNGIKRHLPNPEIFLNYGFAWNEVKDVNQETINQYTQCNLIKESKKQEVYYLCPERKIKRWLRSPEIFNSYPDNNWNNIQVISKYEMDHYPTSNLIKLNNSNDVYLIEGNKKRLIKTVEEFEREGLDWGMVMGVGEVELGWFGN